MQHGHSSEWEICLDLSKLKQMTAGCGWGYEDLSSMDIRLNGKFV